MASERVRLKIGNLANAVLVSGQAYQDPKDALNEFVSNAADEYAEAERRGERIRVALRRKGRYPLIQIDDDGRGMTEEKLREVARSLFKSGKAGDERTLGEKAIGILAFQQLGARCDIVTRPEDSSTTLALRLQRGKASAQLDTNERKRARSVPGTSVYLSGLDPDTLRVLTQRKVVDYLRRRRGAALARGEYVIEVQEGRSVEVVTPEQPDGVRIDVAAQPTLWGRIEFSLWAAPPDGKTRRVAVVGRAGTTIIDDLATLDEFEDTVWASDQVSGQITFATLQQSAGRRAILRDPAAFPVFVDAVRVAQPRVEAAVARVTREVDEQTADRLSDAVRKIFSRVLRELADLENPMRTPLGGEVGDGALFHPDSADAAGSGDDDRTEPEPPAGGDAPAGDAISRPPEPVTPEDSQRAKPERSRSTNLPTIVPDPEPGEARSRFDPDIGTVFYNDHHADYLLVKDDEGGLLDYLATLVAKEYVLYNNPRAAAADLTEEMVRMLIRVRRHLRRR